MIRGITVAIAFTLAAHIASANPVLTLNSADSDAYYMPGDTVTIHVDVSAATTNIVGGQFLLGYDDSKLTFVSADPGGDPFTLEILEQIRTGEIDYAVGITDGATGFTSGTMMILTFTAADVASTTDGLVWFRTDAPPIETIVMDENDTGYTTGEGTLALNDLGVIYIDNIAPLISGFTINTNAVVDASCQHVVTFSATVSDETCLNNNDIDVTVTPVTTNGLFGTPEISITTNGINQYDISGSITVSDVINSPAQLSVAIGVTDCAGHEVNTNADVDISDTEGPQITCPMDITTNATGPNGITLTIPQPVISDNCGTASLINDYTSTDNASGLYPLGDTIVTWTLTDNSGNTAECAMTVTVEDQAGPEVNGFSINSTIQNGLCSADLTFTATVDDNCCMDEDDVFVRVALIDGVADMTTPIVTIDSNGVNQITVDGSTTISDPTSCPTSLGVTIFAVDCGHKVAGTASTSPSDGRWTESMPDPDPGTDSVVSAGSWNGSTLGVQWSLDGASRDAFPTQLSDNRVGGTGEVVWKTYYSGGTFTIDATLWGGTGTATGDLFKHTHYTHHYYLNGEMDLVNTYTQIVTHAWVTDEASISVGLTFTGRAVFAGVGPTPDPDYPPLETGYDQAQWGNLTNIALYIAETQTSEITDTEAPILSFTDPISRSLNADAGYDTATLALPAVTADDAWCGTQAVTLAIDADTNGTYETPITDSYTFPAGTTVVRASASDSCGNEATQDFTYDILPYNDLVITLELQPNIDTGLAFPQTLSRNIVFEAWNCPDGTPITTFEKVITFDITSGMPNNQAIGTLTIDDELAPGSYTCITAKDPLHTLRSTVDLTTNGVEPVQYVATITGDPQSGGHWLTGGDLNNDNWIDIRDFAHYTTRWSVNYGTGDTTAATTGYHADISGDGMVTSADFTFIQINYWEYPEATCCAGKAALNLDTPMDSITVQELRLQGMPELADADLNRDGILDSKDMGMFMMGYRPIKRFDANADGVIDLTDYVDLEYCFSGTDIQAIEDCAYYHDYDADKDVDLEDFATFQLLFEKE